MGLWPGLNAVTVPVLTAPVVICVGAFWICPVCSTAEVFATVCPNARGAIIAQTKPTMIRFISSFHSIHLLSCFAGRTSFGCLEYADAKGRRIHKDPRDYYIAN